MTAFREFLAGRLEQGGFTTEDTLAVFLPLMRQVVETHDAGMVAPLDGTTHLQVDGDRIWFAEAERRQLSREDGALRRVRPTKRRAVDVVGEVSHELDLTEGTEKWDDLAVGSPGDEVTRPVYFAGYRSYEHVLDHHDPLTDTFVLGLILASFCLGLDFVEDEDLRKFVSQRDNLFRIAPELHPVLAKVIMQMTELDRMRRPQGLGALTRSLEDYREQDFDIDLDLLRDRGFHQRDLQGRHQIILSKLQQRLFEISRRNRLLHYRPTQQTVNLTQASVPLSFDPDSIRPDQILTWSGDFAEEMAKGKKISLNKYLNFEEALYLPSLLDKIRAEARKDQAEFGFVQLRLVICYLRWSNLKENKERYDSPLLLLPVRLSKKKGVRDSHQLEPLSNEAEINPVLRFYFRELYDLQLPETIDLEKADLRDLHASLSQQIKKTEPAVTLELIDKPRISLIHSRARQRLDQYQKRSRLARRGTRTYPALDYSYARDDFRPLGLQLFRQKVQPGRTHLEQMLATAPRRVHQVAPPAVGSPVREIKRELYSLETDGGDNPYSWEFDLCTVTLGNFKYRKMSLVRDYEALLEELPDNPAFDSVFSLTPTPTGSLPEANVALGDRHPVVPCDPTQGRAIAYASQGKSYIIQGPPGTGKSQTITNLIADYVARGKQVLFVCEKRAAIDVVYHRLEQQGMDALCCLVHDAQADKKELIADLRLTYETFTTEDVESADYRSNLLGSLQRDLDPLVQSHAAMVEERPSLGESLHVALCRAIELSEHRQDLSAVERDALPPYREFVLHRAGIERLYSALADAESSGVYRRHPLRLLRTRLADADHAVTEITEHLEASLPRLAVLHETLGRFELPEDCRRDLAAIIECVEFAMPFLGFARAGKLMVLDPESSAGVEWVERCQEYERVDGEHAAAFDKSAGWREPLPEAELDNAMAQARSLEGSFFSFFKPAWWRMRGVLRRCFDFNKSVVRPTWTQALEALAERYRCAGERAASLDRLRSDFGFEGEVAEFAATIDRARGADLGAAALALREFLLQDPDAAEAVAALAALREELPRIQEDLAAVLQDYDDLAPGDLEAELRRLLDNLDALPEFMHCLAELQRLPDGLVAIIRRQPWAMAELESALVEAGVFAELHRDRRISRYDGRERDRTAKRLEDNYDSWLTSNAVSVREKVRRAFMVDHALLASSAKGLSPEQKETKKVFNRGLRELQHEFKKSRRYKSIRDLSVGDSGVVLEQLKPVWLMSPLSVSDTLPMAADRFDVVIFDEASQITLEEAVPAIFRAKQIIVVGDEMQLPPTNFFSARRSVEEGDGDELDESVEYDLECNSFLNHAARNLSSCMLGWHYRSRSESLISFSNQAFYNGELLTVPDERFAAEPRPEILVTTPADGREQAQQLVARPVSFHLMETGVYESRRNRMEAEYIAEMVRALLVPGEGASIGVVAFSQAQQEEIEDALERLARFDTEFGDKLEAEFEREEEGQFVGLLVKNLENIQGDERDIVIMSVCYGPDRRGKMRMNFGPINLSGGEKRLNVAFSRAKHHMVLVSSIRSTAITNDYNIGANCLKSYLRYAELTSVGDVDGAQRVLHQMRMSVGTSPEPDPPPHPVAARLSAALEERGFVVDHAVGQSSFRCDLAVRRPGDSNYRLGILIDADAYYAEIDPLERDMMKPRLLRDFGWQVTHVLSKDWHDDPAAELERVLALL